jgi:CPA2 family monovalent cation:H+ antiporter-2
MLNPILYRTLGPIEAFLERRPRLWRLLNRKAARGLAEAVEESRVSSAHRAVLVGYGPIGKAMTRLLQGRGIETTIIEMNIETHQKLRSEGQRAVYGDANQREVLEQAGIAGASSLILSTSGSAGATEAIRKARELNPDLHVVARADYLRQTEALRNAGADEVYSGEAEVALAMTDSILRQLGATPDQLDEEETRIRQELWRQTQSP